MYQRSFSVFVFLVVWSHLAGLTQGDFQYIDDQFGDSVSSAIPLYSPLGGWAQGSRCPGCAFQPDPSQAYRGTWMDTTHHVNQSPRSVQFNFTGTSLDVFCILPNPSDPGITATYSLTFILDTQTLQQTFTYQSDQTDIYQYNVNVLSLKDLASTPHVFTMLAASEKTNSTMLFDYARYVNNWSSSSSPSLTFAEPFKTNTFTPVPSASGSPSHLLQNSSKAIPLATIIGVSLGAVVFILIILLLYAFCRNRHKLSSLRETGDEMNIKPFDVSNAASRQTIHNSQAHRRLSVLSDAASTLIPGYEWNARIDKWPKKLDKQT